MAEALKGLFFTDRLRSIISTVTLLVILGVLLGQWIWPKKVELDSQSVKTLQNVVEKMERAASLYEKQGESTLQLNETLKRQLALQEYNRSLNYDVLYKRYGFDPSIPPPAGVVPLGADGMPVDTLGMLPSDNDFGSDHTLTGAGAGNRTEQLQEPVAGDQEKSYQRAPVPQGSVRFPTRE